MKSRVFGLDLTLIGKIIQTPEETFFSIVLGNKLQFTQFTGAIAINWSLSNEIWL